MPQLGPRGSAVMLLLVALLACIGACRDRVPASATAPTQVAPGDSRVSTSRGIWVSREELARKPQSGAAWANLSAAARRACRAPDLSNQDDPTNTCVLAKAIVFATTGDEGLRGDVVQALRVVAGSGGYNGRALALGRELAAYVISADLIDLPSHDPELDRAFRSTISALLTAPTFNGPANLVECHETRPNNWGTHCGASRAAVAAYLGDRGQLDRVAQVLRGWLGDRDSYAGFTYGDLGWQCDPTRPVGVNPRGCRKEGHSVDGVLPDDQRRAGGFRWPPPKENYVYEALQGVLVQAVILQRAGYDPFSWQDAAILRAFRWLFEQADFPPARDDVWEVHLVNAMYGAGFSAAASATPGKNMGYTDFTHAH